MSFQAGVPLFVLYEGGLWHEGIIDPLLPDLPYVPFQLAQCVDALPERMSALLETWLGTLAGE